LVLAIYSALLMMGLVLGAPWWVARMMTSGRYRAGLGGRLGRVPRDVRPVDVWVHAVSVGEVLAASHLVGEMRAKGLAVAVSTTTQAGQELARSRFAGCAVFYMPLDFGWLMRRYLRALGPRLVVTMESELWPNLIHQCRVAGVPLAVVNARVSDRSFPRYMRLRAVWGPLLREVSLFLAQSEATVERLVTMGVSAERVRLSGNLKYDVRAGVETAMTRRVRGWRDGLGVKMVVAGSTLPGEEEMLLDAWLDVQKGAAPAMTMLVIAPRHTNRFDEVFELIGKKGYVAVRCSALPEFGAGSLSGNVVLLLDTIGDLASMYSVASVAFVGGSLVAKGGHNPLEPAQFGVPVVMGESWENFREIVGAMVAARAIRIVGAEGLRDVLLEMLRDDDGLGERGRAVFASQAGATERTMAALLELMR
jgi:3-deoxy-D-manno-octulosonic-acid transferase